MATPNYGYEKRQRELAKKRKAEEKKQKKAHGGGESDPTPHAANEPSADNQTSPDSPPLPAAG